MKSNNGERVSCQIFLLPMDPRGSLCWLKSHFSPLPASSLINSVRSYIYIRDIRGLLLLERNYRLATDKLIFLKLLQFIL